LLSIFVPGIVVMVLAVFAIVLPRRRTHNPVADIECALAAGELVSY